MAPRLLDIPKLPAGVAAAVRSVEGGRVTKVRLVSKIEALDKLCRHLGMYEDKLRVMGLEKELADLTDEEIEGRLSWTPPSQKMKCPRNGVTRGSAESGTPPDARPAPAHPVIRRGDTVRAARATVSG